MSQHELSDALTRTASAFRTEPHKARVTLRSDSALQAGFHSQARVRSHQIDIDEPKGIGGTDLGASPVELVLAALGSCQEITYRAFATALGIPLAGVAVSVEGDIDFRGFFAIEETVRPGFGALRVTVNLTTSASQAQIDMLVAAVNRHCPVLDMLSTPVPSHFETRIRAP